MLMKMKKAFVATLAAVVGFAALIAGVSPGTTVYAKDLDEKSRTDWCTSVANADLGGHGIPNPEIHTGGAWQVRAH